MHLETLEVSKEAFGSDYHIENNAGALGNFIQETKQNRPKPQCQSFSQKGNHAQTSSYTLQILLHLNIAACRKLAHYHCG